MMSAALMISRLLRRAVHGAGRKSLVAVPLVIGLSLTLAPSAMAACCSVKSGGSPNANGIHSLYDIIFVIAVLVFLVVTGFIVYSVWAFRASKHPVAAQIHGNTRLELSLTGAALVILVVIATATFIKLPGIINPPNSEASAASVLSASLNAPTPPNGQEARDLRDRPPVHLALHLRGELRQGRLVRPASVLLSGDGGTGW